MPIYLPTKDIVDPRVVKAIRKNILRGFFDVAPPGDRHESVSEILANIRYYGGIDEKAVGIEPDGERLWKEDYQRFANVCNFSFSTYTSQEVFSKRIGQIESAVFVDWNNFDPKLVQVYNRWFDEIGEDVLSRRLDEETLKVIDQKYPDIAPQVRQAYAISHKDDQLTGEEYRTLQELSREILKSVNRGFFSDERENVVKDKGDLVLNEVRKVVSEGVYLPLKSKFCSERLSLARAIEMAKQDLWEYRNLIALHAGLRALR